jgi:glycosyltransferase involved in cell wall biosynthesis
MITMLHVLETLEGHGGTPRKLLSLARLIDRQHARLVFVQFKPSSFAHEFVKLGWQVHAANTESPLGLAWHIHRIARDCKADVICTHFTRSLVTGFVAGRINRIPIIHNEHSSANYRRGLGRLLARLVLPWVDLIICNSHHTRLSIRECYRGTADKLVTIHNPVEERIAHRSRLDVRATLKVTDNEVLIAHIGRMIPERDQLTLLRAVHELRKTFPTVRLLMIGDGPARADLESNAKQLGIADSVTFIGNSNEIGDFIQAADIYVNPTLDEGFGIAVVEAMLSGIPVVLSDRGAHPELIVPDDTGYLYPGGNSHALASRLRQLIDDPDLIRQVGDAGRRHAQHRFSPQSYSTQYLEAVKAKAIFSRHH